MATVETGLGGRMVWRQCWRKGARGMVPGKVGMERLVTVMALMVVEMGKGMERAKMVTEEAKGGVGSARLKEKETSQNQRKSECI